MMALLSALFLGLAPPQARAAECSEFSAWKAELSQDPGPGASVEEWSRHQTRLAAALDLAAQSAYEAYFGPGLSYRSIDECLSRWNDRADFQIRISALFHERSLQRLEKSKLPGLVKLAQAIRARTAQSGLSLFRLSGHFDEISSNDSLAGYHRGHGSIFMNLQQIPATEWLVIFIHESLHSLDSVLAQAVRVYGSSEVPVRIAALSAAGAESSSISAEERASIDAWMTAGLDRGMLAEYRAWVVTAQLYRQGLSSGAWSRVDWLEKALPDAGGAAALRAAAFKTIDANFTDPAEGLFSLPLSRRLLADLRSKLRAGPPPALGSLDQFILP